MNTSSARLLAGLCLAGASAAAVAVLPPVSEAQKQAAAVKKAAADAEAEKSKAALLASMDSLTARWRAHAASAGKPVLPPVPIVTPTAALNAPTTQAITPPQFNNPAQPANPVKPQ